MAGLKFRLGLGLACAVTLLSGCEARENIDSSDHKETIESVVDDSKEVQPDGKFDVSKVSDRVLIAVSSYPSWGTEVECMGHRIEITKDKEAVFYVGPYEVDRKALEEDAYNAYVSSLDYDAIVNVDPCLPNPNDICDGGSDYIMIYDKNDEILFMVGGFCPEGKEYNEYYRNVTNLVDYHWIRDCENKFETQWNQMLENNVAFLEEAIPEIDYANLFVRQKLCGSRFFCGNLVSVSVPVVIDEEQVSIILTDDLGNKFDAIMYYMPDKNKIFDRSVNLTEEEREVITEPITCKMLLTMQP